MNRYISYAIFSLVFLVTGCFKEYEERYLFEENRLEFNDAVVNSNASGKSFPIIGPVSADEGKLVFQVNMTGKQTDHDRTFKFRVVYEETTAVEGLDYRLPPNEEYVIPANSSFGYIQIDILPEGSGSPTIVLELLPTDETKVMDRYGTIGCRFVYLMTKPDPSKLTHINDIMIYDGFVIGSYSNQNIGNFADLSNFNVYTVDGANANQEHIDLISLHSSSSFMNMMSPSSTAFTGWSSTSHIPTQWSQRNSGILMRLPNPTVDELALFEGASSVSDLLSAYGYYSSTISQRAGYNSTNDGPDVRIRTIDVGDILVYFSAQRAIVALFKVTATDVRAAGSITMQAKTGIFDPDDILHEGSLSFKGFASGNSYMLDLAQIQAHTAASATAVPERVDVVNLWTTSSSYANFFVPAGSFTGWSGANSTVSAWPVRNDGEFIHFQNASEADIQTVMNLQTRDQLIQAYEAASLSVSNQPNYSLTNHGVGNRVRRMDTNSIVYFRSFAPNRDLYAVMIINSLTPASGGNESFEAYVKSHLK